MIKARLLVVDVDRQTGAETPHTPDHPSEVAEFLELPRLGDNIVWQSDLDLDWLEVIRIEHFPTYPEREKSPFSRTEPCVDITAKWISIA